VRRSRSRAGGWGPPGGRIAEHIPGSLRVGGRRRGTYSIGDMSSPDPASRAGSPDRGVFGSEVVDRVRAAGGIWKLPWGELRIPRVFGFCRGVKRALAMLERALATEPAGATRFFLLGHIIHNPWVNDHFQRRGVRVLSDGEREDLERFIRPDDCAVIPAFGVPLPIEQRLRRLGTRIIDTTCGDVLRLRSWAERTAREGFGILIYGRAQHDETVVTKSRLDAAGGKYLVVGEMAEARRFCDMIVGQGDPERFPEVFGREVTNAETLTPFLRLAQVSQTTMLYDETMRVRDRVREAFAQRFGAEADERVRFQPTVCRATQDRQTAALDLCRSGCDLVVVVGGFGSSNTRHLYELASGHCPAWFIEDAGAILSREEIYAFDPNRDTAVKVRHWLPDRRPLRVGMLAGASSPEVVIGEVLERVARLLGEATSGR